MAARFIVHIRVESFLARLEQMRHPEFSEKPVMVAKSHGSGSIVVSASVEAKGSGVFEGMPVRHAQRICPDGVFAPADYPYYVLVSEEILNILMQYTPLLEPHSLGQAFMDVTGSRNMFGPPVKIAKDALERIKSELGLDVSAGVSVNKLIADAASLDSGPGRVKAIASRDIPKFLQALPVRRLPGVGDKTEKRLLELGVRRVGQLALIPEVLLVRQFGALGRSLFSLSRGVDYSPVKPGWPPKVIKYEHVFEKEAEEPSEVETGLKLVCAELSAKLRKLNNLCEMVVLRLNGASGWITDRYRLKKPIGSYEEILNSAVLLLRRRMRAGMQVLGIELILTDLVQGEGLQLSFLGEGERRRRLNLAVDMVRDRFGESSIFCASALVINGRAQVLSRLSL